MFHNFRKSEMTTMFAQEPACQAAIQFMYAKSVVFLSKVAAIKLSQKRSAYCIQQ